MQITKARSPLCLSATRKASDDKLATGQKRDQGKIPGIKVHNVVWEKRERLETILERQTVQGLACHDNEWVLS